MVLTGGGGGIVHLGAFLLVMMMLCSLSAARTPVGLVVISRHGVRRQFPSGTHDFAKYAPGKVFEEKDEVGAPWR